MKTRKRFARIDNLPLLDNVGAELFAKKKVAIAGVGNIGGYTAQQLGMMGFPLLLIDNSTVKEVNLGTQDFWNNQLGKKKVDARKLQIKTQNPAAVIDTLHEDITIMGAGHFADCSAIFCCLDSWLLRSHLQQMAGELAIPLIDAAIDGEGTHLLGRVSVLNYKNENAACMFCSWDRDRFNLVREQQSNSCPELKLGTFSPKYNPPTLSPGFFGAAISGIQVLEGIKLLFNSNNKKTLSYEVLVNLDTYDIQHYTLSHNAHCIFPHDREHPVQLKQKIADLSIGQLFKLTSRYLKTDKVSIKLHRKNAVRQLICSSCEHIEDSVVLIETCPEEKKQCTICGHALLPVPNHIEETLRPDMFHDFSIPLTGLGFVEKDIITARNDSKKISFIFN